jgi:uncharacterized protein
MRTDPAARTLPTAEVRLPTSGASKAARGRLARSLRLLATAPIVLYSRLVSPLLPARCKYYPSCSQYAVESIRTFGVLRGSVLAGWRILRCNPWSRGGVDLPADQTLFTGRRTAIRSR